MCETFRWPTGRSSAARCAPRRPGGRDRVVAALRDCGNHGAEGGSPPKSRVAFSQGHPNSRPPPRHSPSQRKKRDIPIPGHGHFPAQRCLAAEPPSERSRRTFYEQGAAPRGARRGLQPCAGAGPAPQSPARCAPGAPRAFSPGSTSCTGTGPGPGSGRRRRGGKALPLRGTLFPVWKENRLEKEKKN